METDDLGRSANRFSVRQGLHDKEFEALCADLLGVSISLRFERFKPGPDQRVEWAAKSMLIELLQAIARARAVNGRWTLTMRRRPILISMLRRKPLVVLKILP